MEAMESTAANNAKGVETGATRRGARELPFLCVVAIVAQTGESGFSRQILPPFLSRCCGCKCRTVWPRPLAERDHRLRQRSLRVIFRPIQPVLPAGRCLFRLKSGLAAAVQMIDTSILRVHQHGACITWNRPQSMDRSGGGLTSEIYAVVDRTGLPVRLALTAGAGRLLSRLESGTILLADRGYDADWIRALASERGAWANIPPRCNRNEPICFGPHLYRARNLVERFVNRITVSADRDANSRQTISPSYNWHSSGCGFALMGPRPRQTP